MDRTPASREVLDEATRREHASWLRSVRSLVVVTVAVALMWAIGAVAVAQAQPAATPAPSALQVKADATGAWLAATLHAEVIPRQVLVASELGDAAWAGAFWPDTGAVIVLPSIASGFLHPDPDYPAASADAAQVIVHEYLHRAATYACWRTPEGFKTEEGIVQALTADLLPAWGWRFWHVRSLPVYRAYPAEVAAVRAWSARYTSSPTWRTPAASTARRMLWGASCEGRAAMLAEVNR